MADETTVAATFIGSDKIVTVADVDQKTPMGSPMVLITFESGLTKLMPKKTYEIVVTDVASDASIARRSKFNQIVPALKAVLCEYDIEVSEIHPLLQELGASIDNNFARATNFAWTKDDTLYVPNSNPLYSRTLLEADTLIRSIPAPVEAAPAAAAAPAEAAAPAAAVDASAEADKGTQDGGGTQ